MKTIAVLILVSIGITACGDAPRNAPSDALRTIANAVQPDVIVIDYSQWLNDGASVSWKLEPGRYKLEMTANNDGAAVEWAGSNCPKTQPMASLATICDMNNIGQLIVSNPTVFALGKPVSVTIRVTKLSR